MITKEYLLELLNGSESLEEAAEKFAVFYDQGTCDGIAQDCFIAGAKWQAEHTPLPEDTVLFNKGVEEGKRLMMEEAEKPCHTVEEWMEHIKNADELTKAIFSKGPYDVLYDALNRPYCDCYDAIKEFGELCYQTARQEMMKEAVEAVVENWNVEPRPEITIPLNPEEFTAGDKVSVIVIPKED